MYDVLITGGAGFIGCNLARHLLRADYTVCAVDDLSLGRRSNLPAEVPLFVGDVADPGLWPELPAARAVVHLAGASSAPMFKDDLSACFENNIVGFTRVLEYARRQEGTKVVYASTSSVYGNVTPPLREEGPLDIPNFYAVSKYCMEQLARMANIQWDMEVVGLRFMSVYGPHEDHKGNYANLVSQFIWDIEAGRSPVVYGDGEQTRDFTNVGDVVQAIMRIIRHPQPLGASIFNVGREEQTSINHLVALLSRLMELPVRPNHIPNPVDRGYVRFQQASLDRISNVLGYEPQITLEEGIREILQIRNKHVSAPAGTLQMVG
jgi:UDP-glucose 4-epimerase